MKINYKSNAGVILTSKKNKIAIDLFCDAGDLPYTSTPPEIVEAIINNEKPYDNIDYMLYTHGHIDHFNARYIEKYLNNGGKAQIVLPLQASKQLDTSCLCLYENQIKILDLEKSEKSAIKEKGIQIIAFSFIHEGKGNESEENIGYLIELEYKKVFHLGDACITELNYCNQSLDQENIDLLIVPFPYAARADGINVIDKFIKPKKVAIVHLPSRNKDVCGWIKATEKCVNKVRGMFEDVVIFTEINQEILI